jgi:ABC-type nickel/cobalt efflux system permease component RcnA
LSLLFKAGTQVCPAAIAVLKLDRVFGAAGWTVHGV